MCANKNPQLGEKKIRCPRPAAQLHCTFTSDVLDPQRPSKSSLAAPNFSDMIDLDMEKPLQPIAWVSYPP